MKTSFYALVLAALGSLSCSSDADCSLDKDCFKGESCLDGLCVELVAPNNDVNNTPVNNANNTQTNNTNPNNASAYDALKAQYPDSECIVRALDAVCTAPDDNDSFDDYLSSNNGAGGCKSGDESNPIDFTNRLELCATEQTDRYSTNLYPCDSRSFVLEVYVTPTIPCHQDLYTVNLRTAGRDCSEQDDEFRCTLQPDGSWFIQALVPPSNSIGIAYVEINSNYPGLIDFDYDLRFVTRD